MANDRGIEKQIRALREAKFSGVRVIRTPMRPLSRKEISTAIAAKPMIVLDQPPALPAARQETTVKKPKTSKTKKTTAKRKPAAKAKNVKAETIKSAKPKAKTEAKTTKLETVIGLLKREGGCTTEDILAATGWPTVSVPQQARAAGLTLRKKKEGRVTRYWG